MEQIQDRTQDVLKETEKVYVGKSDVISTVLGSVFAGGHVLFEDLPGLGKTLLAHTLAVVLGLDFKRIQFTPDMLPGDITGGYIYSRKSESFELRKGPVFTNILLADEINRASPKTQSALLEAMQEGQVTIEGTTLALPKPFIVLATQNPVEYEGTFPLPEAQVDRFLVRVSLGYPTLKEEVEVLRRKKQGSDPLENVQTVLEAKTLLSIQEAMSTVDMHTDLMEYAARIVRATREDSRITIGASPRGTVALFYLSRAAAAMAGRDYVVPGDIKNAVLPALGHRIVLSPDFWMRKHAETDILEDIGAAVEVPVLKERI
ncbi:MAG: AAA family ATPase [Spirochaetia bacterium]